MTKTIFAGKEKEKFLFQKAAFATLPLTEVDPLHEYFFMRYRPGNAGNRQGEYE